MSRNNWPGHGNDGVDAAMNAELKRKKMTTRIGKLGYLEDSEDKSGSVVGPDVGERASKKRGLSSTDAPSKYWAQGKAFFITNAEHTMFLHADGDDDADNYATPLLFNASIHMTQQQLQRLIDVYGRMSRSDFDKGKEGLELYRLWQTAEIGVLVFKARNRRLTTHLQKGD